MSPKTVYSLAVCMALLLCCMLYFRPMSLLGDITESESISVQINDFGVRNGEPYLDTKGYDNITEEQKRRIIELIREYSYKRTLKTPFSDGAIDKIGNKAAFIYVYDDEKTVRSICISDSGQISINDKRYGMKNAEQFNERLESIFKE